MYHGFRLGAIACLLLAHVATSEERSHDITVDDYFTLSTLSQIQVSDDGSSIAYAETRWQPPADRRNTDLWVVDRLSSAVRRLTFDNGSDASPTWSPDGQFLYFTSSRKQGDEKTPPYNGKRQVWRVGVETGAIHPVTRLNDAVSSYRLSADGKTLYFVISKEEIDDEWKSLRKEHPDLDYGHGITRFSQVWKLNLEHWRSEKLIDENRVIASFEVAPDESQIAMITSPDEELIEYEGKSRVDIWNARTRKVGIATKEGWRQHHASPFGWLDNMDWAGDSQALAFSVSFDGYPTRIYAVEWNRNGANLRELKRPDGVSVVGGSIQWRDQTRNVCFLGEDRARKRVYEIKSVSGGQGPTTSLTPGDVVISSFDFSPTGDALTVISSDIRQTGNIFAVEPNGMFDQITDVNPQVRNWKLPKVSIVSWTGADGDRVEGILELPHDYQPGKRIPLVVEIHGGPTAASHFHLRFWIYGRTLMASQGYALLSPNYHGSTGYGDNFMTKLIGRENEIEVTDILTGVDALIAKGIVDPDKLAVMGWSNGGFLTNCLITATDRFKAASSGAGVLDQVLQWGMEDTPGHVINFMTGLPWALPDGYKAGSPLYNLHKVRTPTLIHVGEGDERVPAGHARTLYRALKHYLNVPTELIVYPGEGHGLTTYKHRKAKMEWDLAWFDRFLTGNDVSDTDAPDEQDRSGAN